MAKKTDKKKTAFSKVLLIQESILLWIVTIAFLILSYICVINQYLGELPWLSTMIAFPWSAYGVSQAGYYKKSRAENQKDGIVYETMILDRQQTDNYVTEEEEVAG